jgi:hypothetical protein
MAGETKQTAAECIADFLKLRMVVTRDPEVKKVTNRLEEQVRAEVVGFERAQDAFRQMLREHGTPVTAALADVRYEPPADSDESELANAQ